MSVGVKRTLPTPRCDREHRTVTRVVPNLGQAQSKDKNVELVPQSSHRGEMLTPISVELTLGYEATGLDRGPKWIHETGAARPFLLERLKEAETTQRELQELQRTIH